MFKALLLIFLGGEGLSSRKSRDKLYDMQCACGLRVNDEISEKHCKESAMLEDSNQASNQMINFNSLQNAFLRKKTKGCYFTITSLVGYIIFCSS